MRADKKYNTYHNQNIDATIPASEDCFKDQAAQISYLGCILKHIIFTSCLSHIEKLYYFSVGSIACINKHVHGINAAALPAASWAKMLGCSIRKVFEIQRSMEQKGYFIISRSCNAAGQYRRNKITPVLPDHHLNSMLNSANRYDVGHNNDVMELLQSKDVMAKMDYLASHKMFIKMDYQQLKEIIAANNVNSFAKVLFLDVYSRAYRLCLRKNKALSNTLKIIFDYKTLAREHDCSRLTILRAIHSLQDAGFITCTRFNCRGEDAVYMEDRRDKSCWEITILHKGSFREQSKDDYNTEKHKKSDHIDHNICSNSAYLYSKDIIIKEIDKIDKDKSNQKYQCSKPEISKSLSIPIKFSISDKNKSNKELDKKLSKVSAKRPNKEKNTSNDNVSSSKDNTTDERFSEANAGAEISKTIQITKLAKPSLKYHELVDNFTPGTDFSINDVKLLTEEEAALLRSKAGRSFNLNFMNQLLLKLKQVRKAATFKHWNFFRKYFIQALIKEQRLEENVNTVDYQMNINANSNHPEAIEQAENIKAEKKMENYLSSIEASEGNDEYTQLKRKIVGNMEAKSAYEVLSCLRGSRRVKDERVELEFSQAIEMTKSIKEAILRAAKSVYGYSVKEISYNVWQSSGIDIDKVSASINTNPNTNTNTDADTERGLQGNAKYLANLPEQTMWQKVRKKLLIHFGEGAQNLDRHWFSKLEAIEEQSQASDKQWLILKAPNSFVCDFVNQNYGGLIESICAQLGIATDKYSKVIVANS